MFHRICFIAAAIFAAAPAALAECPADNHQQLFATYHQIRLAGTNTDNPALMTEFRDNYARCKDDYHGLGFIIYLMSAVITNENDPEQALDEIDFTFQLLRHTDDIYEPNIKPFTYVDGAGTTQEIFTSGYVLNTLKLAMLPKLLKLAEEGHPDPSLIGKGVAFCPYGEHAGNDPVEETNFWVRLVGQSARFGTFTLLEEDKYLAYIARKPIDEKRSEFATNRLAALTSACPHRAHVFLKGRAKVFHERVEELETEIFTVNDAIKNNYYLPMDRRPTESRLIALKSARKDAAIRTVNAYRAFYAAAADSDDDLTSDEHVEYKMLERSAGMEQ